MLVVFEGLVLSFKYIDVAATLAVAIPNGNRKGCRYTKNANNKNAFEQHTILRTVLIVCCEW
jgi:hypothetical protein